MFRRGQTGGDGYHLDADEVALRVLTDPDCHKWLKDPTFRDAVSSMLGRPCPHNVLSLVPLYPTVLEVHPRPIDPPLRKNKVVGKYFDFTTYLDIQFKLLREDLVRDLRQGLFEYSVAKRKGYRTDDIKGIWIYDRVRIGRKCADLYTAYKAQFDVQGVGRVDWKHSKRLKPGSLVCLSANDFKTFWFATVANVGTEDNDDYLKKGLFNLEFIIKSVPKDYDYTDREKTFVMIESMAYFEAYKHCLKGLQSMTKNELPFKESILYLSSMGLKSDSKWNMSTVIDTNDQAVRDQYKAVSFSEWPTAELLGMDYSQYEAFKYALRRKFALIQGPPGTGKTYVGLKIVQTLHCNRIPLMAGSRQNQTHQTSNGLIPIKSSANAREVPSLVGKQTEVNDRPTAKPKPIVIMCYTNHALDQFLEGILTFCKNLIRIGERSKSEKLEDYKLSTLKEKMKNDRLYLNSAGYQRMVDIQNRMIKIQEQLRIINDDLNNCGKDLIDLNKLIAIKRSMTKNDDYLISDLYAIKSDLVMKWYQSDWFENQLASLRNNYSNDLNVALIKWITDCNYSSEDIEGFVPNNRRNRWKLLETEADIQEVNRLMERRINDIRKAVSVVTKEKIDTIFKSAKQLNPVSDNVVNHLKQMLATKLSSNDIMSVKSAEKISDISQLSYADRWRLYRRWLRIYKDVKNQIFDSLFEDFSKSMVELKDIEKEAVSQLICSKEIIGMTITYAAKNKTLLKQIDPKIVVIEEAAEVFECNVVTALTPNVDHLILIGDHKQLKPMPTVHLMAQKYHLDVSLFERMIDNRDNGMPYKQLKVQHRMRPEISRLLVPHIYPVLEDHDSVKHCEDVKGMDRNVFFFNHSHREEVNAETMSKYNTFEAQFIVRLAKHLLFQGYKKSQITILAMYSSQLFHIRQLMKSDPIFQSQDIDDKLRATSVDNYQGEENDIILVSFVRSNSNNDIGFLKVPNRVNVALSRAKKGLYCVGNFESIARSGKKFWINITDYLKIVNSMANKLSLRCSNHQKVVNVMSARDFDSSSPSGGCNTKISHTLGCGHRCPLKKCHPNHDYVKCDLKTFKKLRCGLISDHSVWDLCSNKTVCDKRCERRLGCGHKCDKKCREECQTQCKEWVLRTIEGCNHVIYLMCYQECVMANCSYTVDKSFEICGHTIQIKCCEYERQMCDKGCDQLLVCGHRCRGSCHTCCQNRLHIQCKERCPKTLICGHQCNGICGEVCPPCDQICENGCSHENCFHTCSQPCISCRKRCARDCPHKKCPKLCPEKCEPCLMACPKKLSCRHQCIGLCGQVCPTFCLICNSNRISDFLVSDSQEQNSDPSSMRFVQLECKHAIEVNILQTLLSSDRQNNETFKRCPKCQTVIIRCLPFTSLIGKQFSLLVEENRKLYCYDIRNQGQQNQLAYNVDNLLFFNTTKLNDEISSNVSLQMFTKLVELRKELTEHLKNLSATLQMEGLSKYQLNIIENKVIAFKALTDAIKTMANNIGFLYENRWLWSDFGSKQIIDYFRRMEQLLAFVGEKYSNTDQQRCDVQKELNFLLDFADLLRFGITYCKSESSLDERKRFKTCLTAEFFRFLYCRVGIDFDFGRRFDSSAQLNSN